MYRVLWSLFPMSTSFLEESPQVLFSWQLHQMFAHAFFFFAVNMPIKRHISFALFLLSLSFPYDFWLSWGLGCQLWWLELPQGQRVFTGDLHPALQEGVLDPPWERTAWCQTPSLAKPPCKTSAQLCLLYCLFGFLLLLSFLSLTQAPLFPIIPNMRNSHTLVEISLWD